jgi:SAM-dependent methyltransferase
MTDRQSRECAEEWEKNARLDPLFAILSDPDGRGGKWDIGAFFATGVAEIDLVFARLAEIGALPRNMKRFLDFGCGVGRLSQALAQRFSTGIGVDISDRMIELAKGYKPAGKSIDFVQNGVGDLKIIPTASISFVYSHIVLQHISNALQRNFIAEFTRVLEPGGIAAFQIPVRDLAPRRSTPSGWKAWIPKPVKDGIKRSLGIRSEGNAVTMQMNYLREPEIARIVDVGGCDLIRLDYSNSTEPNHNGKIEFFHKAEAERRATDERHRSAMLSGFYFIRKRDGA